MQYLIISLIFLTSVLGIAFAIYTTIKSKSIFDGSETKWQKRLTNSLLMGASASLIFLSIILLAGLVYQKYSWTLTKIISFTLFSLIPGILIFLGSSWQFIVVNWFRKKIKR